MENHPPYVPHIPPPAPGAPGGPGTQPPNSAGLISVTPGTAFKTGFFFTLGAAVAGLIVGIVYFLVFVLIMGSMINAVMPTTYY